MRPKTKLINCMFLLAFCIYIKTYAEDKIIDTSQKYIINLTWIAGTQPPEYIFVINGSVGFKTVEALKKFIAGLPENSILEWSPGCLRIGEEPLLSSKEEMDDFKRFCQKHKIVFRLIPSG